MIEEVLEQAVQPVSSACHVDVWKSAVRLAHVVVDSHVQLRQCRADAALELAGSCGALRLILCGESAQQVFDAGHLFNGYQLSFVCPNEDSLFEQCPVLEQLDQPH